MRGYHDASYGDSFADIYDDWYADITDVEATTALVVRLAERSVAFSEDHPRRVRVLELGVGTGRLAIPLCTQSVAGLQVEVHGLDSSARMLEALAAKAESHALFAHLGDMVDGLPEGPFDVVLVAYNTLFNLRTDERQRACFRSVAERLAPGGAFVVETFVPSTEHDQRSDVAVRSIAADRVVLSVSTSNPSAQEADGNYVEFTEAGGVRLRPWSIRWATPEQLDDMAAAAGLVLLERWEDVSRQPFVADSPTQVSVFSPSASHRLSSL